MSSKDKKYEEKKAIVTDYEGVKFVVILPDIETSTEAEGRLLDISAKAKRDVKKEVQAIVVDDPRLPTRGPIPKEAWDDYWKDFIKNLPMYQEHIAGTLSIITGSPYSAKNIRVSGTMPTNY